MTTTHNIKSYLLDFRPLFIADRRTGTRTSTAMRHFIILLTVSIMPIATKGDDPLKSIAPSPLPTIPIVAPRIQEPATTPDWKKAASGEVPKDNKTPEVLPPLPSGEKKTPLVEVSPKTADAKKIKEDLEKLLQERDALFKGTTNDSAVADERAKLKSQLADLISKLDKPKPKPAPLPERKSTNTDPAHKSVTENGGKLVDPLRLGLIQYQDGDVKAALSSFRMVNPNGQSSEEKAFTQYLTACCHKQLGQMNEAVSMFREIADAKQDAFITECALWQLGAIRQMRELDAQLEQLRIRRKAR